MGETYSNDICNLAATAVENGQGGLFLQRDVVNVGSL